MASIQVLNRTKGPAWLLEPQALGKLITYEICSSIKKNLSHACVVGSDGLGKLITYDICSGIKQNLSHACVLGPDALKKLITYGIYSSIKQNQRPCMAPQTTGLEEINNLWHLFKY